MQQGVRDEMRPTPRDRTDAPCMSAGGLCRLRLRRPELGVEQSWVVEVLEPESSAGRASRACQVQLGLELVERPTCGQHHGR